MRACALLLAAVAAGLAGAFLLWGGAAAPGLTAVFDALTPAPEAPEASGRVGKAGAPAPSPDQ